MRLPTITFIAGLALLVVPGTASAAWVNPSGEASGPVAVSGTGDAYGTYAAISGTGQAFGTFAAASGMGNSTGMVAASGTDDPFNETDRRPIARATVLAVTGRGHSIGGTCGNGAIAGVVAFARCGGVAVSAAGRADAHERVSCPPAMVCLQLYHGIAISGTGSAQASLFSASVTGRAEHLSVCWDYLGRFGGTAGRMVCNAV